METGSSRQKRWHKRTGALDGLADRLERRTEAKPGADCRAAARRLRNRALVHLVSEGLTTGQVAMLDVDDLSAGAGILSARTPRAKHAVACEISDRAAQSIRLWMAVRAMVANGSRALFVTLHTTPAKARPGERMSATAVRNVLRKLEDVAEAEDTAADGVEYNDVEHNGAEYSG